MSKRGVKILYSRKNSDGENAFPDGELYTRLPVERIKLEEEVFVIHSGQPEPSTGLVELAAMTYALEDEGIAPNKLFCTYFPYGRQDKNFKRGEPNMAKHLLEDILGHYQKIYVIDFHSNEKWVNELGIKSVSAVNLLKQEAEGKYGIDLYYAPDKGGQKRTGIKGANKNRIGSSKVDMELTEEMIKESKGKVVGVIDDLVSTGTTMCKAYDKLKNAGAKKVIALETHGIRQEGIDKIKNTYDDFFMTNTIDRKEANVDVTELIMKEIGAI